MTAENKTIAGMSITRQSELIFELHDGSRVRCHPDRTDEILHELARLGVFADSDIHPGTELIARPARGEAGLCFIPIEMDKPN